MKTYVANSTTRERNWLVVDANGQTLGRLATQIADALRGKRKPEYTPHVDTGDFVVVINAEKISVTGNKRAEKRYYRHSGYPGGIKSRTLEEMLERRPEEVIRLAVKGMLPRNRLARKQITKLKVYAGPDHPHEAQKPSPWRSRPDVRRETPSRPRTPPAPEAHADAPPRSPPPRPPPPAETPCRGARRSPPSRRRSRRAGRRRRDEEDDEARAPRVKPAIPGADLEVDIVVEGDDRSPARDEDDEAGDRGRRRRGPRRRAADRRRRSSSPPTRATARPASARPRSPASSSSPAPAPTRSTAGRSTTFFPRDTLQRTIRQPLETVGYEDRMDVVARMHGGGVASQAGALRHGISRALLEADPNLRGELKRRGFLTRDARVKERKKAGLKKARKRPQFTKR